MSNRSRSSTAREIVYKNRRLLLNEKHVREWRDQRGRVWCTRARRAIGRKMPSVEWKQTRWRARLYKLRLYYVAFRIDYFRLWVEREREREMHGCESWVVLVWLMKRRMWFWLEDGESRGGTRYCCRVDWLRCWSVKWGFLIWNKFSVYGFVASFVGGLDLIKQF